MSLRVRLIAADPARQRDLAAMLAQLGHRVTADAPDVVLYHGQAEQIPDEIEAPVLLLSDAAPLQPPAGLLPNSASAEQLDLALRSVAAGLIVRSAEGSPAPRGLVPATGEDSPLTPRETEILALIGQGLSNKAVARQLHISAHTVKFHLEAIFAKLEASTRAEAVAKGLLAGAIRL